MVFYEVVAFLLGAYDGTAAFAGRVALLAAVYNAVLTPIVYPLLRRMTEGPELGGWCGSRWSARRAASASSRCSWR